MSEWMPHRRETWPWRIGTTKTPVQMSIWNGHGSEPEFTRYEIPTGTKVKIVMVSRLGDVGITEDLNAEIGYRARVSLSSLVPLPDPPKEGE